MNEKVKIRHWVIVVLTLLFTWFFGGWRTAHAGMGAVVAASTAQRAANERAAAPARTSACYNVQDADARTMCLARAHREPGQCYSIQRADMRAQCLAEVQR